MKKPPVCSFIRSRWKTMTLSSIVAGSLVTMIVQSPFGQDPSYHSFADQRGLLAIPHFANVVSNLPFLLVGVSGLKTSTKDRLGAPARAWRAFFAGVAMVSFGSAYYHLAPSDETLVWDRLPMTVGFMGLFVALLGEHVNARLGAALLLPALSIGLFSVLYWHFFDDLRLYYWVQLVPLLIIPVIMLLFPRKKAKSWLLLPALALYLLAKIAEAYDQQIYALSSGIFAGHSVKHLLAALGCTVIWAKVRSKPRQQPNRVQLDREDWVPDRERI